MTGFGRNRGHWQKMFQGAARAGLFPPAHTHLQEVHGFGSNPGNLRMFRYLPDNLAAGPPLVVVLHGCTQTAAGYDLGAGWSTLADRYGFALLMPEQQRANNPNGCSNWFLPEHSRRDAGEPSSIRQMIEKMVVDNRIDRDRVFVTGLSAGGAMTSVMLACYPEVFAAGAIVAGLPYGAAANVQQAFESMYKSPARSAREWGDLVRSASAHSGPWPRVSVWHGNADKTVIPSNAGEILKQWTAVHGLPVAPSSKAMVDGYPREVWRNASGDELIESYSITGMAHGTPLATGEVEGACGAAGPFLLQVGISSSYHIAKFFGLAVAGGVRPAASAIRLASPTPRAIEAGAPIAASENETMRSEVLGGEIVEGEILDKDCDTRTRVPPSAAFEIGAVINKALKAAGLIKD